MLLSVISNSAMYYKYVSQQTTFSETWVESRRIGKAEQLGKSLKSHGIYIKATAGAALSLEVH